MVISGSLQRKIALRRKLHILRTLTKSKAVKKSSIILDGLLYIHQLKLKLEAIKREYLYLMAVKHQYLKLMKQVPAPKEVKVEKVGEEFSVKVMCKRGENRLVSVLEALEEMGLNVVRASVSCNSVFTMEAIAVSENNQQEVLDVRDVTQVLLKAVEG